MSCGPDAVVGVVYHAVVHVWYVHADIAVIIIIAVVKVGRKRQKGSGLAV